MNKSFIWVIALLIMMSESHGATCVVVGGSNQDRESWDNVSDTHQLIVALQAVSNTPGMKCRWYSYVDRNTRVADQIANAYSDEPEIDVLVVGTSVEIYEHEGWRMAHDIATLYPVVAHTPYIMVTRYPDLSAVTRDNDNLQLDVLIHNANVYNSIVSQWPVLFFDYPVYETFDGLHATNKVNYISAMEIMVQLAIAGFSSN